MPGGRITYFVVLGFKPTQGRHHLLLAEQPFEAPSAQAAIRRAQQFANAGGAGVAFSRTGDPSMGDWDDAIVLGQFGPVPEGDAEAA